MMKTSAKQLSFLNIFLLALLALSLGLGPSRAEAQGQSATRGPLEGRVVDAITGLPVARAKVQVLQSGDEVLTDEEGYYAVELPVGRYSLLVEGPMGEEGALTRALVVRQRVDALRAWPATVHLLGLDWHQRHPSVARPYGLPSTSGEVAGDFGAVRLVEYWARRWKVPVETLEAQKLTMPQELPATVRVGRRLASTCRGNPIQRIEEVPLEEYVQGVLLPEIGVFRSAASGRESSREVFKAFAIAARTYALYFVIGGFNDDEGYDLDDTACNQRYTDDRDPWVEALVAETAGQVLVRQGTTDVFDKFEYAASCGRHDCWPEYAAEGDYVSDVGLAEVCVGNWCGHNNCAAHQDNPNLPGSDRCLVRGLCQWGSLERSAAGQDHLAILAHYQPNLSIRGIEVEPQGGTIKGFVRTGDTLDTGNPVPGATVALSSGQAVIVGDAGYFEFGQVTAGPIAMSVNAGGYLPERREFLVVDGEDTWQSVLLNPEPTGNNGQPDMGQREDLGPDPDLGQREDLGQPDLGREDLGQPGGLDQGVEADLPEGDAPGAQEPERGASSERFTVFAVVPKEGLADGGCGCQVTGQPAPWRGAWLTVALGLAGLLRGRRKKS